MARAAILILSTILVVNSIACCVALRCYQCTYTNSTSQGARILGMIPTQSCLNLDPSTDSMEHVLINKTCTRGCQSTHFVKSGIQLVLRGCLNPGKRACANYSTHAMTKQCCKDGLCNKGIITSKNEESVECYQCIGSTVSSNSTGNNKYAHKRMLLSADCMESRKFNHNGANIETNKTCEGGCLTSVIRDTKGHTYVTRGCASAGYSCVSASVTGADIKNPRLKSVTQTCCNTDFCNGNLRGETVAPPATTAKTTTFQNKTLNPDKTADEKKEHHNTEKGSKYSVVAMATKLNYDVIAYLVIAMTSIILLER